jgi:hypothetical protein
VRECKSDTGSASVDKQEVVNVGGYKIQEIQFYKEWTSIVCFSMLKIVIKTNRYMKKKNSEIAATPQIRVEEAD